MVDEEMLSNNFCVRAKSRDQPAKTRAKMKLFGENEVVEIWWCVVAWVEAEDHAGRERKP